MVFGDRVNMGCIEKVLKPVKRVERKTLQELCYEDEEKRVELWNNLEEARNFYEDNDSCGADLDMHKDIDSRISLARLKIATSLNQQGSYPNIIRKFNETELGLFEIIEEFRFFDDYNKDEIKDNISRQNGKVYEMVKKYSEKMVNHTDNIFENPEIRPEIARGIKILLNERTQKIQDGVIAYIEMFAFSGHVQVTNCLQTREEKILQYETDMSKAQDSISLIERLKLSKSRVRNTFFKKCSPLEQINADELFTEKIRLEREGKLKTAEVEKLAEKKKELFQKGFNATKAEQRSLARKIKETDRDVKLKEKHLQTMNKQILAVNNMQFIHEQKKLLESSGVMSKLTNLPPTELNKFLSKINLQTKISENGIDIINDMFTAEFDLDGEMEDDSETQNLMNVWDSATEEEVDEVYSEWESKLESGGISNNSNKRLRSCTITDNEKNSKNNNEETDQVHFTVTGPSTTAPGESFVLDVWAHFSEQRNEVLELATINQGHEEIISKSKGPFDVQRNSKIMVQLSIPDLIVNDPYDEISWNGEIGNADFLVEVPEDISKGKHGGILIFSVMGLTIANLNFVVDVNKESGPITSIDIESNYVKTAFASYASKDRNEVISWMRGFEQAAPHIKVFVDVVDLRAGDKWFDQINEKIKNCDAFYLFWSCAASHSKWVKEEWRTALREKGLEYIDPVPMESPDKCPPPNELNELHFNDKWAVYQKKKSPVKKFIKRYLKLD